jgi:hypothetical protein
MMEYCRIDLAAVSDLGSQRQDLAQQQNLE